MNNQFNQLNGFGMLSKSGVLSRTSQNISQLLDSIPAVQQRFVWYVDSVPVVISGEEHILNVGFTNSAYLTALSPRFTNGAQPYRCDPDCVLIGAAISSTLANADSISIMGKRYSVSAQFTQKQIAFPHDEGADLILDISELAYASSFKDTLEFVSSSLGGSISSVKAAEFIPIIRTMVKLIPNTNYHDVSQQLKREFENQQPLYSEIKKIFSLQGSDNRVLDIIEGPFFDIQAKQNQAMIRSLFFIAAVQLLLVAFVNLISLISRLNLMRSHENHIRYALGASKLSIFINNIIFIQPVMLLSGICGGIILLTFKLVASEALIAMLNIPFPNASFLMAFYLLLLTVIALLLPALINIKILVSGTGNERAPLSRKIIYQVRSLNVVLFLLAITSVFLGLHTYTQWQLLKDRGIKNLSPTTQVVEVKKTENQPISSHWVSQAQAILTNVTGAAFLETLPGDRRLSYKNLRFNDEACNKQFDSWINNFYGEPFKTLTNSTISTQNWSKNDIAISQSILELCGFDKNTIIGKYVMDTDNNQYKINAVIADISYDLYSQTPQYVIYQPQNNAHNLYALVLPGNIKVSNITKTLEQLFIEYNLPLKVSFSSHIIEFIKAKLVKETVTMFICFTLMGVSLAILYLAFTQHINKVLAMRNTEWGTMRAMGANKNRLTRCVLMELVSEWLLAILIGLTLACGYMYFINRMNSASLFADILTLAVASALVLIIASLYVIKKLHQLFQHTPSQLLRYKGAQ
ncbi:FtsX-like permease family protein [Neptunicella marina]|uniref:ABC transporter permease n=1 Tax=Neptunicella marina TaxID=2125989 RepID=A0A8J6LZS1_9ALTE|nr:ABC transporter permease [Neptunicella marina]MBC3766370.1 ABC transporter permease [Neptunicella marina]